MTERSAHTTTLKAGPGYEAPWHTIDADTIEEHNEKCRQFVEGGGVEAASDAALAFQATWNVAKSGLTQQPAPQAVSVAPVASQGVPQQQPVQQGAAQPHPEGTKCSNCGSVLVYKTGNAGPQSQNPGRPWKAWKCPSPGRGHDVEWL